MARPSEIEPSQVIETLGELIAALTTFSAKVPAQSFMSIPGGIRPQEEDVESYEETVYRFRDRAGITYKALSPLFLNSLEAFEAGKVFDAVPPLQQAVEQLVQLHKDEKVQFNKAEQDRIRDLYHRLHKLFPEANKPEVDLPPPTTY
ncbi:MAG: hypothetical protein MRJ96_05515 [Nitrospirales bacterium]|nr:hypothetical protein [Nitrospira sp.]MDR4500891.1 hypothetical protein [Nitrospirales bacterium]